MNIFRLPWVNPTVPNDLAVNQSVVNCPKSYVCCKFISLWLLIKKWVVGTHPSQAPLSYPLSHDTVTSAPGQYNFKILSWPHNVTIKISPHQGECIFTTLSVQHSGRLNKILDPIPKWISTNNEIHHSPAFLVGNKSLFLLKACRIV